MRLNGVITLKEIIGCLNTTEHKFDRSQLPVGAIVKDSRLKTFMLKETVEQFACSCQARRSIFRF